MIIYFMHHISIKLSHSNVRDSRGSISFHRSLRTIIERGGGGGTHIKYITHCRDLSDARQHQSVVLDCSSPIWNSLNQNVERAPSKVKNYAHKC